MKNLISHCKRLWLLNLFSVILFSVTAVVVILFVPDLRGTEYFSSVCIGFLAVALPGLAFSLAAFIKPGVYLKEIDALDSDADKAKKVMGFFKVRMFFSLFCAAVFFIFVVSGVPTFDLHFVIKRYDF